MRLISTYGKILNLQTMSMLCVFVCVDLFVCDSGTSMQVYFYNVYEIL